MNEITIDKNAKQITFTNNGIGFSQFGIANEILDLIENQTKEIERLNNIINTMLEFNLFVEECPLSLGYTEECAEEKAQDVFYEDDYCEKTCNDDRKKCWLKYFERLQELKRRR